LFRLFAKWPHLVRPAHGISRILTNVQPVIAGTKAFGFGGGSNIGSGSNIGGAFGNFGAAVSDCS
jgi:hypothetical protein